MPTKTATAAIPAEAYADTLSIPAAIARWRTWAEDIGRGGPTPPGSVVMDAAYMLKIADPAGTLAEDARVMAAVRAGEARTAADRAAYQAAIDAEGGQAEILQKIESHKAEVARLEALIGPGRAMALGYAAGETTALRRRNPRLFDSKYSGERR